MRSHSKCVSGADKNLINIGSGVTGVYLILKYFYALLMVHFVLDHFTSKPFIYTMSLFKITCYALNGENLIIRPYFGKTKMQEKIYCTR